MGRLIDADAFIQMMEEKCDPESTLDPWVLSVCRGGVKMMPTVDAAPVRRGRWVHHPEIGWGSTWLCSECGEKTVETIMGEPRYKFCPMCGADMRKDGGNGQI